MRNNHLFSKCASGILSFSLIMAAIPTTPVMAEDSEGISDEAAYEEDYTDYAEEGDIALQEVYEEAPIDEAESSPVFVITRYVDFDTAEDGTYIEEEIQEQYGSITAVPGTSLDDLGLPEDLEIEGYWLADGPDYPAVLTLEDMEWKLKSDTEESTEIYSEASPEGVYIFEPDYETWLLTSEDLDGIQLEEGVEELELTVTITSASEETQESQEESSADILNLGEGYTEETTAEAGYTEETTAGDGYTEETAADAGYTEEISAGDGYTEETYEDIFSTLDTTAISEGTTETWQDTTEDGTIVIDDGTGTDTGLIESGSSVETTAETEDAGIISLDDSGTDISETTDTTAALETTANSETTAETTAETNVSTEVVQSSESTAELDAVNDDAASSVTGTLNFYSDAALSNLLNTVSAVTINQNSETSVSDLYCGADLSQLYVTFTADSDANPISLTDSGNNALLNLSTGSASVKMTLSDSTVFSYTLTVSKAAHTSNNNATCTTNATCSVCGQEIANTTVAHTWTDATCTTPKTCSVCGATEGEALGHSSAGNATCTTNATCSRCGVEIADTALGHDWADATCTTPKTCNRCGITEGDALGHSSADNATCTTNATCSRCGVEIANTALGHSWVAATCTTPKTCSRCSATEGTALGHDLQDDWETISVSTNSEHGVQERYCHRDSCDYFESRDLNIVGNPENNSIQNLTEGANYELNTRLTFSAVGAGMSNTDPINGDVRYVPSAWSIQGTAGSWLDNYNGAFSISKSGTYTLTVTFQKQVYNSGWTSTDIADSKSVTFTVGGASTDGSDDAVRINPSTGDDTTILPFVIALAAALIVIIVVIVYKKKRK